MDMAHKNKAKYLYGECHKILSTTPKEEWKDKLPDLLRLLREQYYKT